MCIGASRGRDAPFLLLILYRHRRRVKEPNEVRELWASLPRGTGECRALWDIRGTDLLSRTLPHSRLHVYIPSDYINARAASGNWKQCQIHYWITCNSLSSSDELRAIRIYSRTCLAMFFLGQTSAASNDIEPTGAPGGGSFVNPLGGGIGRINSHWLTRVSVTSGRPTISYFSDPPHLYIQTLTLFILIFLLSLCFCLFCLGKFNGPRRPILFCFCTDTWAARVKLLRPTSRSWNPVWCTKRETGESTGWRKEIETVRHAMVKADNCIIKFN